MALYSNNETELQLWSIERQKTAQELKTENLPEAVNAMTSLASMMQQFTEVLA